MTDTEDDEWKDDNGDDHNKADRFLFIATSVLQGLLASRA